MAEVKGVIKIDRLLLLAIFVFALLLLCGLYAITHYEAHYSALYRNVTEKKLQDKASSLEKAIDNQFALLYGLCSFVQSRFECFSDAQGCPNRASVMTFLANIYASTNSVHSISITTAGYQVSGVTDSVEALTLLKSDPDVFDVVLTAWMMPRLDGSDFIGELCKIRPEIKIIVCSGFRNQESMAKIETLNVDGLIEKPLDQEELLKNIAQVLGHKG